MLDWLKTFGDLIVSISEFIISFFRNALELIQLIFKGYAYVALIIQYLPIQYQVVLSAFVSFSVIVTIVHFGE